MTAALHVMLILRTFIMPGEAAVEMDRKFEKIGQRYIEQSAELSPVSATERGDHRWDDQLDQVGPEARARKTTFCREMLAELAAINPAELSRASQIDHAMLLHRLRRKLWGLETLQEWAWNPLEYTGLVGDSVYSLTARPFAPVRERLANVASRLEEFPRLLGQVRDTLEIERVPKIHAETAIRQNSGVLSILDNLVEPQLGELPPDERNRLKRAMATARKALETHQQWLESELLPGAAGEFRLGRELYDAKLSLTLDTSLTRDQLRQRAEQAFRQTRDEMYEVAKGVYAEKHPMTRFPDDPSEAFRQAIIRAGLELAYQETPPRDRIVETAERSMELTTDFVRRKDLVTIPDNPLEIILMPEFRRGVALAYCDSPGPFEVGQKTFYAVAPPPADWTAEQVQSFLREYNLRSLHNLTVHEAMPGHFLQIAHANRYPGRLRAVLSSGTFVEGWACYSEGLMVEQGFLDGDPLMRLVVLKWHLRGITNALMDQAIHAGGMTREQAMRLMIEGGFQEEREAAGKWTRAQLTSAQLSTYFVGWLEHIDLREEAERTWGEKFDLKTYHDKLLSFGSPPVRLVRALLFDREIPRSEETPKP